MSVVNFSITKPLEQQVNQAIKDDGFTSKAEFFRFAAKNYISKKNSSSDISQEEFERESRKLRGKKFPSLEEQLADL
jgi:metal-responsive CopG/Arc/MetJ family transcriptional regulator